MAKVVTTTYRVEELPPGMVAELDAAPQELVRSRSTPAAGTSMRCSRSLGGRAVRPSGLTKEKLAELLDDC
jgi:hypothetical protein